MVRTVAWIVILLVSAECFLRLIDYRTLEYNSLEMKLAEANEKLAEANKLNQSLRDFNLNRDLTFNELMVVHVPDKTGNYIGRTRSFLVPVHGVKTYPIADDGDKLEAIRKAIAEYVKDNSKEMEK